VGANTPPPVPGVEAVRLGAVIRGQGAGDPQQGAGRAEEDVLPQRLYHLHVDCRSCCCMYRLDTDSVCLGFAWKKYLHKSKN